MLGCMGQGFGALEGPCKSALQISESLQVPDPFTTPFGPLQGPWPLASRMAVPRADQNPFAPQGAQGRLCNSLEALDRC